MPTPQRPFPVTPALSVRAKRARRHVTARLIPLFVAAIACVATPGMQTQAQAPPHTTGRVQTPKILELKWPLSPEAREEIHAFIQSGGDPNYQGKHGYTLLGMACARGDTELVQTLLDGGADPNYGFKKRYRTPIESLIQTPASSLAILEKLLDAGLDANSQPTKNAVERAIKQGTNLPLIARLIEAGFDVSHTNVDNLTPLNFAEHFYRDDFIALFKKAGGTLGKGQIVRPAVFEFLNATEAALKELERLIKAGAPIDIESGIYGANSYKVTPLGKVCSPGQINSVSTRQILLLIEHGADVSRVPDLPFRITTINEPDPAARARLVAALVKAGVDLNAVNDDGQTPLAFAKKKRRTHWFPELEAAGAHFGAAASTPKTDSTAAQAQRGHHPPHFVTAPDADTAPARRATTKPSAPSRRTAPQPLRRAAAAQPLADPELDGQPVKLAILSTEPGASDIADLYQAMLSDAPWLTLVERAQLNLVISEQQLTSALSDDDALQMAQTVGAELLMLVSPGGEGKIQWRMVDVRRGVINAQQQQATADVATNANDLVFDVQKLAFSVRYPAEHKAAVSWAGMRWISSANPTSIKVETLNTEVLNHLLQVPGLVITERRALATAAREVELGAQPSDFVVSSARLNGTLEQRGSSTRAVIQLTDNVGHTRNVAFELTPGKSDPAQAITREGINLLHTAKRATLVANLNRGAAREANQLLRAISHLVGGEQKREALNMALSAISLDATAENYNIALSRHRSWTNSIPLETPARLDAVRQYLNLYDQYLREIEADPRKNRAPSVSSLKAADGQLTRLFQRDKPLPIGMNQSMRQQIDAFWDRTHDLLVAQKKSTLKFKAAHFDYVLRRKRTTPMTPTQVVELLRNMTTQWNHEAAGRTEFPVPLIFSNNLWDSANIVDTRGRDTAALLRKEKSPHLQAAGWLRELWVTPAGENIQVIHEIIDRFIAGTPGNPPYYLRSGKFDSDFASELRDADRITAARAEEILRRVMDTQDFYPWKHYWKILTQLIDKLPAGKQSAHAEQAIAALRMTHEGKKRSPSTHIVQRYSRIVDRNARALRKATEDPATKPDLYISQIKLKDAASRGRMVTLRVHAPIDGETPWVYGVQFVSKGKLALFRWDTDGDHPRHMGQFDTPADVHPYNVKSQIFPGNNRVFVTVHDTLYTIKDGQVTATSTFDPAQPKPQSSEPKYGTDGKRLFIARWGFLGYVDPDESPKIVVVTSRSRLEKTNILDGKSWTPDSLHCDPVSGDVYMRVSRKNMSPLWRFDSKTLTPQPTAGTIKHANYLTFSSRGPLLIQHQIDTPIGVIPINPETMVLGKSEPLQADEVLYSPTSFAVQGKLGVVSGHIHLYNLPTARSTLFLNDPTLDEMYPLADGTLLGRNHDLNTRNGQSYKLYKIRTK